MMLTSVVMMAVALSAPASRPLERLAALSGPVATGFGRGSRKLGIPTANLPCSLFQSELAELPTGVYLGWAALRGQVYPCVANAGFSPTFKGQEAPEKVVEAHLLHDFGDEANDFHSEELSLLLLGYLREEQKFGSLDELLATIRGDIALAARELGAGPKAQPGYARQRGDDWLMAAAGRGGGRGAEVGAAFEWREWSGSLL